MLLGDLEKLLRAWLDIGDENKGAFKSRIQHLQRMSFPPGTNTGRGKKFDYGWQQIIQFSIAFDLIDQGFTPELATSLVKENRLGIAGGITKFSRLLSELENPQQMIMSQKLVAGHGVFLGCVATGLGPLKRHIGTNDQFIEAYKESDLIGAKSLTDFLLRRNVTFLNFASSLLFSIHYIAVELGEGVDETISSFLEWTTDVHKEKAV